MFKFNPVFAIDSYKLGHVTMYPEGVTEVYCNVIPRSTEHLSKLFADIPHNFFDGKIVAVGMYGGIKEVIGTFDDSFFTQPFNAAKLESRFRPFVGDNSLDEIIAKLRALHELAYLPLIIKSLPEGTIIDAGIPVITIVNTHPDFAWLPGFLETFISSQIWKPMTTATIARAYRRMFEYFAELTGTPIQFTQFQGHDFSSRGMSGIQDAGRSGIGHLSQLLGTDSVASIEYLHQHYNVTNQYLGGSIPASEHAVMTMGLEEGELDTFKRILNKYPTGAVSIVSDSYDYWNTITNIASELKPIIMARQPDSIGLCKTVFRPDSGNPINIICGTSLGTTPEAKGSVQCLWETFGGTITSTGHKQLDEHVGLIYGDSITPKRAYDILRKLHDMKFASGNIVFGIGSYTYQYITRDSLGIALKATNVIIDNQSRQIFKQPKTDSGKNSARGKLRVDLVNGNPVLVDGLDNDAGGTLTPICINSYMSDAPVWSTVRSRAQQ